MEFSHIAYRGWTSARLAGAPSGSALAAPLPVVVRTPNGRRAPREGEFMSLAVYQQCRVSTNAHPALQGAPSLPV
jgi:hypothetical protein